MIKEANQMKNEDIGKAFGVMYNDSEKLRKVKLK